MKPILFALTISTVFFLFGCKKCITCSNRCYYCDGFSDTICSTTVVNPSIVDTIVKWRMEAGANCVQTSPTSTEHLCGSSGDRTNLEQILTPKGYECK
jgi:hypothetical protein